MKLTQDADIDIDEDLKYELREQLGSKAMKLSDGSKDTTNMFDQFKNDGSIHKKRESK